MLPKKFRLNVLEFYQNPQRSRQLNSSLGVLSVKSARNALSRFAVVVPAFLDKRTSYRHRTKRIIIEAIRKCLPGLAGEVEVLIKARKILKKQDRLQVEREIRIVFHKIGLL